eukprot:jgi/Chrzof1/120/Cz01g04030.t1
MECPELPGCTRVAGVGQHRLVITLLNTKAHDLLVGLYGSAYLLSQHFALLQVHCEVPSWVESHSQSPQSASAQTNSYKLADTPWLSKALKALMGETEQQLRHIVDTFKLLRACQCSSPDLMDHRSPLTA